MKKVKKELIKMKDLGPLHHFLGVTVAQSEGTGEIWLGQLSYTVRLLDKFSMKPVRSPVNPNVKLTQCENEDDVYNQKMYLVVCCTYPPRPVLTLVVLLSSVQNLLRSAGLLSKESINIGLLYSGKASSDCVGYSDADWARDVMSEIEGPAAISWKSSKQTCVALKRNMWLCPLQPKKPDTLIISSVTWWNQTDLLPGYSSSFALSRCQLVDILPFRRLFWLQGVPNIHFCAISYCTSSPQPLYHSCHPAYFLPHFPALKLLHACSGQQLSLVGVGV